MIRDPFYRQIIEALNLPLNPDDFEHCAADLLRLEYPTLVPIRGGSDSGMDGAVADGEGEPFPLVTTTGRNAIGNLTRNLSKYVEDGGTRRRVVFATSRALTPQKRKNLFERARWLGFTLIQIYDQDAFADRLYRSPEWCRVLLRLTGTPPTLSILPKTQRPLLNVPLIGRSNDTVWLTETIGDRLIVGQPGSGKTYLLHLFAKENSGLFAVSSDIQEIANAFRSEQPRFIIVDDAHTPQNLGLVAALRHFRESSGAEFDIVASSWPGPYCETSAEALNLPGTKIHELKLLSRDEIVEVVEGAGIAGSLNPVYGPLNQLIREIVNQAEGRPGLAVTLTHLFLQGDIQRIVSGDALSRSILRFFLSTLGPTPRQVLAALSVGGDAGMSIDAVAATLSMSAAAVHETAVGLDAGGVIAVIGEYLSVRPPALRYALIREVFGGGHPALPESFLQKLMGHAPYLPDTARTLVSAVGRGAVIRQRIITEVIEQLDHEQVPMRPTLAGWLRQDSYEDIWRMYGWLGRNEVRWILKNHPEQLTAVAWPGLENAPDITIPMLFEAAVGDHRPLHSHPEHPLRQIEDWIQDGYPGTGTALTRRRILLGAVTEWLRTGRDTTAGLNGLRFAFSPIFEVHTSDPGSGNTMTLRTGWLLRDELNALCSEWSIAQEALGVINFPDWRSLQELVTDWAYRGRISVPLSPETDEVMRDCARQMLGDLLPLMGGRPGLLHWAQKIAEHLQLTQKIQLDDEFEILYPRRSRGQDLDDWKAAEKQEAENARDLARIWSELEPEKVIEKLEFFEREAQVAGIGWPEYTRFVCYEIAKHAGDSQLWLEKAVDSTLQQLLVEPFLLEAAHRSEEGWIRVANEMLADPNRRAIVVSVVLTLTEPSEELLSKTLELLDGMDQRIEVHCIRNEIPETTLLRLLQHPTQKIAGVIAVSVWHAEPKGMIPDSLRDAWRDAVLNWVADDYHLGETLLHNAELAENWLSHCLSEPEFRLSQYDQTLGKVIGVLDYDARCRLLQQIPDSYGWDELVNALIDGDPRLYKVLLELEHLKRYHLSPLARSLDAAWAGLAVLASSAEYTAERIAHAVEGRVVSWSGNESEMWASRVQDWESFCSHDEPVIREIASFGKRTAEAQQERASHGEYIDAVYGRD